ncbi:hypothetical protein L1987_06271 [Smallanthus sonchifolius]|uniref:Uncharacterized protein n=1 Tax=Smallanthus sonchifolius TaxID=185202 RepID=A0ACB9JXT7_9ASTR|nr:hypothetical protein L1987_06271 [Smallanthus sonchifolius]
MILSIKFKDLQTTGSELRLTHMRRRIFSDMKERRVEYTRLFEHMYSEAYLAEIRLEENKGVEKVCTLEVNVENVLRELQTKMNVSQNIYWDDQFDYSGFHRDVRGIQEKEQLERVMEEAKEEKDDEDDGSEKDKDLKEKDDKDNEGEGGSAAGLDGSDSNNTNDRENDDVDPDVVVQESI